MFRLLGRSSLVLVVLLSCCLLGYQAQAKGGRGSGGKSKGKSGNHSSSGKASKGQAGRDRAKSSGSQARKGDGQQRQHAREHDARKHDARKHDAREHHAREHDAREHDAREHHAREHDAREQHAKHQAGPRSHSKEAQERERERKQIDDHLQRLSERRDKRELAKSAREALDKSGKHADKLTGRENALYRQLRNEERKLANRLEAAERLRDLGQLQGNEELLDAANQLEQSALSRYTQRLDKIEEFRDRFDLPQSIDAAGTRPADVVPRALKGLSPVSVLPSVQ